MIVGIDGNEANTTRRVGIGEYAYELLHEFGKLVPQDMLFRTYLKDMPRSDLPPVTPQWQYEIFGPKKLWTQIALPVKLLTTAKKPHVFFTPSHYAPRFAFMPTAISIMDLSYIRFPELFAKADLYQLTNWTAYSARAASKIFTISQSSKNDIIKYYHIPADRIVVTYPGIKVIKGNERGKNRMETIAKKYGISDKFILFVGTIQPRKNITRLIEAFGKILKKHGDIDLVIVGKKGWLYEPILAKPKELGVEQKVKFLDFVEAEDLNTLYEKAICYCLPSLYEGFGLPVLEAMQHGCPVVTSNVSSLPEAGGDACLYVDPENVDDITKKLLELIEQPNLRKELREKGYKHVKQFSWEKTAGQTLAVLRELGGEK